MNWELLRERIFQYYSPLSIESVYSIIPSDCGCSRIDERIDIDEVLCSGCSSLLREQQQKCYTLSISTERYENDITPFVPDTLLDELFNNRKEIKIYRTENPLLQKFVCGCVLSSISGNDNNIERLWECNHSSFLKERNYTLFSQIKEEEISSHKSLTKPKKIFNDIISLFSKLKENDFYIASPDVNSLIFNEGDEEISLKIDEKSFISYNGVRSIFSINKFNVFSSFAPLLTESEVNIPKGCDSYKSKECSSQISSRMSIAPAYKLTDELLFYQRELGYPLFASQTTLYSLLLSFYTLPSVTSFFENNKVYSKIFEGLFDVNEYRDVMRELRLLTEMKVHSYEKILSILKRAKLRSDVIEYLSEKVL